MAMMAALAEGKGQRLAVVQGLARVRQADQGHAGVMATVPSQAAVLGVSPISVPLPSATSSGAKPRMMG
jgi:hypothetical protein